VDFTNISSLGSISGISDMIATAGLRSGLPGESSGIEQFRAMMDAIVATDNEEQMAENRAQIRAAAEMFESYFLQQLFSAMRSTTGFNENSLIPQSNAERIFTEMLDEEMANSAAQQGGVGLADMIYRQMTIRM